MRHFPVAVMQIMFNYVHSVPNLLLLSKLSSLKPFIFEWSQPNFYLIPTFSITLTFDSGLAL